MHVEFTGRHYTLDDEIRQYSEKKLEKLEKFVDEPVEAHLILEIEHERAVAELVVYHRHGTLQATQEAEEMKDAILAVIETVTKQARRSRQKFQDKRRRAQRQMAENQHWPVNVIEGASISGGEPRIMKTHSLPIKPMTLDEASVQLQKSKNDFFVFLDSSSDKVSVLYRRKDENFGLIAPEF